MSRKSLGLAAIALGCSMGTAVAQDTVASPTPAPPSPQQEKVLKALAEQHAATAKAGAPTNGSKPILSGSLILGWNFAHATSCGWFQTLLGLNQWFYIFPQEGGIIFSVNNIIQTEALQVPCGNGNLFAWHVIDLPTGAYDQTITYNFK